MTKQKKKFLDWHQADILSERYFDIVLSDFGNTFLLLIQAPIIALAISIGWSEIKQPTDTLYYIMLVSCVWFGCINSCKEIVKERAIYIRERMFGLNIFSYLFSKIKVLAIFAFVQCLLFVLIINYNVPLKGTLPLLFFTFFLCTFSGSCLGLILSALVNTPDKAVALAPVITIPQILFSKMVIPENYLRGPAKVMENLMIVKWGFIGVKQIASRNIEWLELGKSLFILLLFSFSYFILTLSIMKISDQESI